MTENYLLPGKLPCKVKEGLLKIIVALGRYLIVLQILLPVEGNLLGLNLPVLHINLVSAENYGYILTNPKILMKLKHHTDNTR